MRQSTIFGQQVLFGLKAKDEIKIYTNGLASSELYRETRTSIVGNCVQVNVWSNGERQNPIDKKRVNLNGWMDYKVAVMPFFL